MQTSKSPKQIARVAYTAAQQALPLYSHEKSPHKFTQPQLVACLVLKEFFTTDYRGIVGILNDSSDLTKILELTAVPHYAMPKTKYRKLMRTRFPQQLYGQRWQVETVMSMLKRNLGAALRAKSYWSQCREIMLRLFVHNVMIVFLDNAWGVFYGAWLTPFSRKKVLILTKTHRF
ncbi:MAG: hypothetical protein U1C57_01260 [Candidatus Doudnabacteria bacterium]|nr:hypothetical protein [Candidatus Doudnabacteria bacterium]